MLQVILGKGLEMDLIFPLELAAPSSQDNISELPQPELGEPSGQSLPADSLAAISRHSQVFPAPGSPLIMLIFEMGK